jgi:hypothetical protein
LTEETLFGDLWERPELLVRQWQQLNHGLEQRDIWLCVCSSQHADLA